MRDENVIELHLESNRKTFEIKTIYRWISNKIGTTISNCFSYTQFNLKECAKRYFAVIWKVLQYIVATVVISYYSCNSFFRFSQIVPGFETI